MSKALMRPANLALSLILSLLCAGILLDGKLYNQPIQQSSIYPINNATSIELHFEQQLILGFKKQNNQWQQAVPLAAPVQLQRMQVLLNTNTASQRTYSPEDLPVEQIFAEPITLKIDDSSFEFGTLEPVSQLRYVRANEQVYLQPDTVVPLLSTVNNAFINLQVTEQVQSVSIHGNLTAEPDAWSHLQAVDILTEAPTTPGIAVQLVQNQQTTALTARHTDDGYILTGENGFHYLLSKDTDLGLTTLLP